MGVYQDVLGLSARRVMDAAQAGARPSLWDVGAIHAAARSTSVPVRDEAGALVAYHRSTDTPEAFLAQVTAGLTPDDLNPPAPTGPVLAFELYHDRPLPLGS